MGCVRPTSADNASPLYPRVVRHVEECATHQQEALLVRRAREEKTSPRPSTVRKAVLSLRRLGRVAGSDESPTASELTGVVRVAEAADLHHVAGVWGMNELSPADV